MVVDKQWCCNHYISLSSSLLIFLTLQRKGNYMDIIWTSLLQNYALQYLLSYYYYHSHQLSRWEGMFPLAIILQGFAANYLIWSCITLGLGWSQVSSRTSFFLRPHLVELLNLTLLTKMFLYFLETSLMLDSLKLFGELHFKGNHSLKPKHITFKFVVSF